MRDFFCNINFGLLKLFSKCKDCCDGYFYPYYGLAPHYHDLTKTGVYYGSTNIKPKRYWPDNFVVDPNRKRDNAGIWYCPNPKCKNSKNGGKNDI